MAFHVRYYTDDHDLDALLALTAAASTSGARHGYYEPGDVVWQLFQWPPSVFDPAEHVWLWRDDDEPGAPLAGFAWVDGPGEAIFQLHPRMRETEQGSALLDAMIMWSEERARQANATRMEIPALADDALYDAALQRHGYTRGKPSEIVFQQRLDDPIPAPTLPDGWTVRHIADLAEYDQRVELHRAVWRPSRVTLEAYERLRAAPLYRPDLDLVVVSPEGAFAAYCICWYDAANHAGEFEPVGVHRDFRRRGFGKIVVQEGLRRLQALGATLASVTPGASGNSEKFVAAAAHALYASAGFTAVNYWYAYSREWGSDQG
ncbi:MAG TPA: GNAT family N-acetyltransferase [Ktedonobacterales bacterium]|nr:GNAT family N-acetyltransferase [Ktedonobacterales bacterium]